FADALVAVAALDHDHVPAGAAVDAVAARLAQVDAVVALAGDDHVPAAGPAQAIALVAAVDRAPVGLRALGALGAGADLDRGRGDVQAALGLQGREAPPDGDLVPAVPQRADALRPGDRRAVGGRGVAPEVV